MKKFIIFICSFTVIISSLILPVSAQNYLDDLQKDNGDKTVKLYCKVDFLMSLDDGSVVIEKNADEPVAPASLTKIMTALLVLKNKDLNDTVTVAAEAIESLYGTGSSTSGLKTGEQMSVYDMLCCLLIPSGNDAAAALAIEVGGTIENFVKMMNDEAAALGCKNTHFDNPHGLDSDGHKTTARDLAIITQAALEYASFKKIVACPTYQLSATNMHDSRQIVNTNYLISKYRVTYYNPNCKGIKTGSTEEAGKCLVSYAAKGGYEYLAIAMGGEQIDTDNDGITENQAFMDSNRMYNWAFKNLKFEIVTKTNQFVCSVPVKYNWKSDTVSLVAANEVVALVPQGNDSESVLLEPDETIKEETDGSSGTRFKELSAPIKKGDFICKAKIIHAGQQIGTVDLVAAEDVSMSVLLYCAGKIGAMAKTKLFIAVLALIALAIGCYIFAYVKINRRRRKMRQIKIMKYNELHGNTQKKK